LIDLAVNSGCTAVKSLFPPAILLLLASPGIVAAATLEIEVDRAEAGTDIYTGQPIVTVTLKPESRAAFGTFTNARIGQPVQIRLGDKVLSAPIVREPITGGVLVISGQMTVEGAQRLAEAMRKEGASLTFDGSDETHQ
jgi:preprotein translocase subunit SecD